MSERKSKVTEHNLGDEIFEKLVDFTGIMEKRARAEVAERVMYRKLKHALQPVQYRPDMVSETRRLLDVSPAVFALLLGVPVKTVHEWERGTSLPNTVARRFMDEIRRSPDHWRGRLVEETA